MRIFQPARSKFSNRDVHLSLLLGGLLNDSDNSYRVSIPRKNTAHENFQFKDLS
jgi:hypothetical protein